MLYEIFNNHLKSFGPDFHKGKVINEIVQNLNSTDYWKIRHKMTLWA